MKIDIQKDWGKIKSHFRTCNRRNMHVVISSVDSDQMPTVTPIGSLFLNDDQTGFYFEKFATKLRKSSEQNKNICVLAVNSRKWFWLKALFKGKFSDYPGVKLYGELGEKRDATPREYRAFQRRVQSTKRLKGYHYLWKDMAQIREIKFTKAEKINLGKMTKEL
ncbi:hypothetical protein [Pseudotenacibaculum haliotis]|uniref:Pyridoxamine 5'-phosphate oxidase putative domain-containing protein n=1 Tax=Pseudotenacibaculum haliotis TaxID=1862138 RepID=A0ABW5LVT6_9FLAO